MKNWKLGFLAIALSGASAFGCADFSGNWTGTCTGQGSQPPATICVQQSACNQLLIFANGGSVPLLLDGKPHGTSAFGNNQGGYQALWDQAGNFLHVTMDSGAAGGASNEIKMDYTFTQLSDKSQVLSAAVVIGAGGTGSSTDCTLKKASH